MICVKKLNDQPIVVNATLIKFIEEVPDTLITLQNGEKIVVKDSAANIVSKVINYLRATRLNPA